MRYLSVFLLALLCVASAIASPVAIFSTGVDGSGNVLAAGSADPHWTVNGTTASVVTSPTSHGWVANPSDARWISLGSGGTPGIGSYTYTTTFDLTGFHTTGVFITANLAADDGAVVFLNGVQVFDDSSNGLNSPWTARVPLTINSGFVQGVNTLSLSVYNVGGPGGLLFDVTGSNAIPGPEPGTASMLLIAGLAGLAAIRRRR
jgi:hypothetical protein